MNSKSSYNLIWRWHFFAGLFIIPILVMLSVTGAIYLFKPQYHEWKYSHLLNITPTTQTQKLPPTQLLKKIESEFPKYSINEYVPSNESNRSDLFKMDSSENSLFIYINPYNAEILGSYNPDEDLQKIIIKIHGELLVGKWGDRLIELAVSWGIILILTGLFLWWPRGADKIMGVLVPRIKGNSRTTWKDLHLTIGFYSSIFILFFMLSGLAWTGFWGEKFAQVWSHHPEELWNNPPQSQIKARTLNTTEDKKVAWSVEPTNIPESTPSDTQSISLDQATQIAQNLQFKNGFGITPPSSETGVYTISLAATDPRHSRTVHLDQYSGEVLADIGWEQFGSVAKAVEFSSNLHEGKIYGWVNQLFGLIICLVIIFLCVSGVITWWKRKPANQFGAPPESNQKTPLSIWLFGIALGLLFPLFGMSAGALVIINFIRNKFRN